MVDPSVGYIFRARDTSQNIFDLQDARFAGKINIPKDWLENDENNTKYIQNRTHYILPERLELLKPTWVMKDEETEIVTIDVANAPTFITYRDSNNQPLVSKGYKMSDIYTTEDEAEAQTLDAQLKTLLRKCYYYDNYQIVKISDKLDEVEAILALDPNADTDFEISWVSLQERIDPSKLSYFVTITLNQASSKAVDPLDRKPIKYIYFLAVKDAGYYAPDLFTTPYWGVKEEDGVRSWYRITTTAELETKTFDDSRPANPNVTPSEQYSTNKYYLEYRSFIAEFEEGIYGFSEFDYETMQTINTNQAFIINSKERVVQLPRKYIQDVWDALASIDQNYYTKTQIDNKLADKMDKSNPTGTGTMTITGNAIFTTGAYEGSNTAANKLIKQSILDSTISTINAALNTKLNIANPAATGNFTLETDKVIMDGTTGDITTKGDLIVGDTYGGGQITASDITITGNITATDLVLNGPGDLTAAGTIYANEIVLGTLRLNDYFTQINTTLNSIPNIYETKAEATAALALKRDITDLQFNGTGFFSGDLYVNGLSAQNAKKVATEDQLVKCLGIYYNDQRPTNPSIGDYIYIINEYQLGSTAALTRYVYNGTTWLIDTLPQGKLFSDQQWTNINTNYNPRVTALENQVQSLTTQVQDLTTLINELIPQAEGNWFGPSTFQPYVNASNIAYPRD